MDNDLKGPCEIENIETIDEIGVDSPSTTSFDPTVAKLKAKRDFEKTKRVGELSKLFILLSFLLVILIIGFGLVDTTFSKDILSIVWEKIAAIFLVIFGHVLGQSNK